MSSHGKIIYPNRERKLQKMRAIDQVWFKRHKGRNLRLRKALEGEAKELCQSHAYTAKFEPPEHLVVRKIDKFNAHRIPIFGDLPTLIKPFDDYSDNELFRLVALYSSLKVAKDELHEELKREPTAEELIQRTTEILDQADHVLNDDTWHTHNGKKH